MSIKQKLAETWHRYLQTNFNVFLRSAPLAGKQRLYKHVDIQQNFDNYEKERKKQRLQLIEYRKKLKRNVIERELQLLNAVDASKIDFIEGKIKETQDSKDSENVKKRTELAKELIEINKELESIDQQKVELSTIDKQIAELEPDMVLLRGIEKKTVMTLINYYEFQSRHVSGVEFNPETKKSIETVHYQVVNNLPLRRELLYEVVPELFQEEIGELEEYKQKLIEERRPSLKVQTTSVLQVQEQEIKKNKKEADPILEYKRQEMEMMWFVYQKGVQICEKYDDWITMKLDQGAPNTEILFDNLAMKQPENLVGEELDIYNDYQELVKINDDYHNLLQLNQIKVFKEQRVMEMPQFVKESQILSKAWADKWEQIIQHSFDFSESKLLPRDDSYESQLDKVLTQQKKHDIQSLIAQSQKELKAQIGGDVPVRLSDRQNKDDTLVKQVQVMTDMMHMVPSQEQQLEESRKNGRLSQTDNPLNYYRSEERRIMLTEYPKILFLNNKDPKKYNLLYWAEHFNIEPQKLKNIFNFVAYPMGQEEGKVQENRILRFIS